MLFRVQAIAVHISACSYTFRLSMCRGQLLFSGLISLTTAILCEPCRVTGIS